MIPMQFEIEEFRRFPSFLNKINIFLKKRLIAVPNSVYIYENTSTACLYKVSLILLQLPRPYLYARPPRLFLQEISSASLQK